MVGFDHVMAAAIQATVAPDLTIPLAPLRLYVLLKLVAFSDRKAPKDLGGVLHCLEHYQEHDERRYGIDHDGEAVPFEYTCAYLVGLDGREFLDPLLSEAVRTVLDRFASPDGTSSESSRTRRGDSFWRTTTESRSSRCSDGSALAVVSDGDVILAAEANEREAVRKAIYSGPNRSGICVCGHQWEEHHLGMVARSEATETNDAPKGYIPQECEHFWSDEMGGLDDEGNPNGSGYRDTLDTQEPRASER